MINTTLPFDILVIVQNLEAIFVKLTITYQSNDQPYLLIYTTCVSSNFSKAKETKQATKKNGYG